MKQIFNAEMVVSITAYDKREDSWHEYVPERSAFWIFPARKAYIKTFFEQKTEMPVNCFLQDGKIYKKPYVEIVFAAEVKKIIRFDTYKQACDHATTLSQVYIRSKI